MRDEQFEEDQTPRTPRVRVESDQSVKKRDLELVRRAKRQGAQNASGRGARGRHAAPGAGRAPRASRRFQSPGFVRLFPGPFKDVRAKVPPVVLAAVAAVVVVLAAVGAVSCALGGPSAPDAASVPSVSSPAEASGDGGGEENSGGEDGEAAQDDGQADGAEGAATPQTAQDAQPVDFVQHMGVVYQMEELEGGCEVAALTSVLESMGFDLDSRTIADEYLSYEEGDMVHGYAGDPYYYGGSFPPPIVDAANAYLEAQGSSYRARELTGSSFDELTAWVEKGYPVLVWTTMYLAEPQMSGIVTESYEWYDNEHCVVYYGQDAADILVSDPLEGLVSRDAAEFQRIYEECGSMAAVIC